MFITLIAVQLFICVFCFKQKTAYEMRISDWSSDVCSADLEALDLALDRGPRDDYRRTDVRSLRRLAALIKEDRGYLGHRLRLKSYIHAGRNVICCTRKLSLMRCRIAAVDTCHALAAARHEKGAVSAEPDEGSAGRDTPC